MNDTGDENHAETEGGATTYGRNSKDEKSQVELASGLDQAFSSAVLAADDMGLNPAICVGVGISNLTEYGCWRSDGSAPLVAITALHALTRKFESYLPDGHKSTPVEIRMAWTAKPNGNVPVFDLLTAVAKYIASAVEFENVSDHSNHTTNRH